MQQFWIRYKMIFLYGGVLAVLLLLLRWLEYHFIILQSQNEIYSGTLAVLFTGLGIWLTLQLRKPKKETVIVEKPVYVTPQSTSTSIEADNLHNLSKREIEVLKLMGKGLSNAEIAEQLFVSLNTVKTHSSKIYEKMEVKRRTQAVEKAKQLNIIN